MNSALGLLRDRPVGSGMSIKQREFWAWFNFTNYMKSWSLGFIIVSFERRELQDFIKPFQCRKNNTVCWQQDYYYYYTTAGLLNSWTRLVRRCWLISYYFYCNSFTGTPMADRSSTWSKANKKTWYNLKTLWDALLLENNQPSYSLTLNISLHHSIPFYYPTTACFILCLSETYIHTHFSRTKVDLSLWWCIDYHTHNKSSGSSGQS